MELHSLLRRAENEALSEVTLSGKVLDLGGDKRSTYQRLMRGTFETTVVNLSDESEPDVRHDLELPLPFPDASYDAVLLINVLEHVFECRQLIQEARRVLKPGGQAIIVVPFLFPIHPSPHDYWRFTRESLERLLSDAGFTAVTVRPLGSGVFAARSQMLNRLLPGPIRFFDYVIMRPCAELADRLFNALARATGKQYVPADYPLGYFVQVSVTA